MMPTVSNPRKLLLALFFLAVAALNAGSSGGIRFGGGDEDGGSGFGGTGRTPTEGGGLGGTGLKPLLGDAGEVRIRFEPDAVAIAEQVGPEEIRPIAEIDELLPPVTVVTAPEFAAENTAEIAITDAIQARLRRDAVIYERILESIEGYYPPETQFASSPTSVSEQALGRQSTVIGTPDAATAIAGAVVADVIVPDVPAANPEPDPARITWAELAKYLAENGIAREADATPTEAAENPAAVQRPNRISRPELPQVQRGRLIQRPTILPPRVQPMRF